MKKLISIFLLIGIMSSCEKGALVPFEEEEEQIFQELIVNDNEIYENDPITGVGRTAVSFDARGYDSVILRVNVQEHFTLDIVNAINTHKVFEDLVYNWSYVIEDEVHTFIFEIKGNQTKIPLMFLVSDIDDNVQTIQPVNYRYKLGERSWQDFNVNF